MIIIVIYLVLKSKQNYKKKMVLLIPFFASLGFAIFNQLLQRARGGIRESYFISTDALEILFTIYEHLYASLPLSYLYSNHGAFFSTIRIDEIKIVLILYGVILFLIYLFNNTFRTQNKIQRKVNIDILFFGLLFWIIPGIFISFSPIYQNLINFGVSHIPVYISYFGVFFIFYFIYLKIVSNLTFKNKSILNVITGMIVILIVSVNYTNNIKIIQHQNAIYWNYRNVIEKINQAEIGLFHELDEKSLLLIQSNDNLSFDSQGFIYSLINREILNIDIRRVEAWFNENLNDPSKINSDDERFKLFGKSDNELVDKYRNTSIFKYSSTYLGDAGFVSSSKIQNLEFDESTNRIFVGVKIIDLYLYNLRDNEYRLTYTKFEKSMLQNQEIYFSSKDCQPLTKGGVRSCSITIVQDTLIDYGSINVEPVS